MGGGRSGWTGKEEAKSAEGGEREYITEESESAMYSRAERGRVMDTRWRVPRVGILIQYGSLNLDLIVNPVAHLRRTFPSRQQSTNLHSLAAHPYISQSSLLVLKLPLGILHLYLTSPPTPPPLDFYLFSTSDDSPIRSHRIFDTILPRALCLFFTRC